MDLMLCLIVLLMCRKRGLTIKINGKDYTLELP